MPRFAGQHRIAAVELDERTVVRRSVEIEHERAVAIYDLLEDNRFALLSDDTAGPFHLRLSVVEGRLMVDIGNGDGMTILTIGLSLTPFRRVVKDYFTVCESYYEAIKRATPSQIEAIDMGRRGLHNEGAEILRARIADKVAMDTNTARRLFTLLCVLHIRG